jgi:hypothetical protein
VLVVSPINWLVVSACGVAVVAFALWPVLLG